MATRLPPGTFLVSGYTVMLTTHDFGVMTGLAQPHINVVVGTTDLSRSSAFTYKLSSILTLKETIPSSSADEYVLGKQIGGGNFGKVHKGLWSKTKDNPSEQAVAIKVPISREFKVEEDIASTLVEGILLSVIKHENIIRLLSLVVHHDQLPWLVFEFANGGSLHGMLGTVLKFFRDEDEVPEFWTESLMLKLSYGIISGLNYLHCHKCVHRDLTAKNVLLMENYVAKLCDFGLSSFTQGGGVIITGDGEVRRTVYSLQYCAPEVVPQWKIVKEVDLMNVPLLDEETGEPYFDEKPTPRGAVPEIVITPAGIYDFSSDIWAYGVLLYQIWSNGMYVPYSTSSADPSIEEIKDALLVYKQSPWHLREIDGRKDTTIGRILRQAFKFNPRSRISAPSIKEKLKQEMNKTTELMPLVLQI